MKKRMKNSLCFILIVSSLISLNMKAFSNKEYQFVEEVLSNNIANKTIVNEYLKILFNSSIDTTFTEELSLNPLLIITLMDIESSFKQNIIGDNGVAVGFFQLHDVAMQDVCRYSNELNTIYYKYLKQDFTQIIKYPVRQLQFALSYLCYYNQFGGTSEMIKMWNHTSNFKEKLYKKYIFYYQKFINFTPEG